MSTLHPNATLTSDMNRQTSATREEDDEVKPYVVVAQIGSGSFATVYKGYHQDTHKQVAIKTVSRSKLTTKLFENLQSEIGILKALSHRHITRLIDIVRAEKNIYLIMEYCSGGDLTNYIKKRGRVEGLEYIPSEGAAPQYYPHPRTGGLDEIVVRSFLRQLARALKFLRQKNLIHRDIKPQNLLLSPVTEEEFKRGHPVGVPILKVADFGFARSLPNAMMAETLCGSPLYMAPEILRYEKYDAKADLWSVGAVLYEMAVGKPPFRANNHIELLGKIDNSKGIKFPDEDRQSRSSNGTEELKPVPPDVKQLIRSLLKRKPVERASFEDFFKSTALAKSKFPRPREPSPPPPPETDTAGRILVPEHHNFIPPEVLDSHALIPPSKFNFRRREVVTETSAIPGGSPLLSYGKEATGLASPSAVPLRPSPTGLLSTEGSIIPGETEEDGQLRREYVLVGDTRAVEFNRAIDEITGARTRPLRDRKVPHHILTDDALAHDHSPLDSPIPSSSNATFPPPPNAYIPTLSSSPSSAGSRTSNPLTRALNLASKKLFGTSNSRSSPHYRDYSSSSPRRQQLITGKGTDEYTERDPMEDELLATLEDLAQKTDVLTHWADEMYEFVKAVPQKPLPDPSKFEKREGEAERQAIKRKNADIQAEYNAMACVALYLLLMSFSQKGIDKLRNFHEHMKMRDPDGEFVVSEGFDDALTWFKEHFIKCNDRASLVKTWLPSQYTGAPHYLDQMIYDHALGLSRSAARKELLDQATSPDECEKLYEESLWCLYALQDDLLQDDNPFLQEDRATIATWIKRTKLRLVRCRVRMGMNDRDRLRDARADKNLDDVERIPPPWEPSISPGAASVPPTSVRGTPPSTTPLRGT